MLAPVVRSVLIGHELLLRPTHDVVDPRTLKIPFEQRPGRDFAGGFQLGQEIPQYLVAREERFLRARIRRPEGVRRRYVGDTRQDCRGAHHVLGFFFIIPHDLAGKVIHRKGSVANGGDKRQAGLKHKRERDAFFFTESGGAGIIPLSGAYL